MLSCSANALQNEIGKNWVVTARFSLGDAEIFGHGLGSGFDLELAVNARGVGADGGNFDAESLRGFFQQMAAGEEVEDFAFARAEEVIHRVIGVGVGWTGFWHGRVLSIGKILESTAACEYTE